jgi:hypothetical protein
MATFSPEKFIDFVEHFDFGNPNHKTAMLAYAKAAQIKAPELFADEADWVKTYRTNPQVQKPKDISKVKTETQTLLKVSNFSQPDASTCQSTCIAMAVNDPDIRSIRSRLLATGLDAGSPTAMEKVIRTYTSKYKFDSNASLEKVYEWLKAGEFLITHGWFTGSGHVICLDGIELDSETLSHKISVKDPWSEFNAPAWRYDKTSKFFDGYYSSRCIYAACVAGTSVSNARDTYNNGSLNVAKGGMWVHRFLV